MLAIEKLCRRMERQQTALIAALEQWPKEHRVYRPSIEAWSAAQVLSHVTKVERGTALDVRRALREPGPQVTKDDAARAHKLVRWLLSPRRVEVPKSEAGAIWPDEEPDFTDMMQRWRLSRKKLLALARSCEADGRCVFVHPGSGPMDLVLVMRFLYAHARHHEFQLERLREAASGLRT